MGRQQLVFPFEGCGENACVVFTMYIWMWFSIPAYCNIFRYRKLSQRYYFLLLWRSGKVATVLRPLKSAVWNYISPKINFCLYTRSLSPVVGNLSRLMKISSSQNILCSGTTPKQFKLFFISYRMFHPFDRTLYRLTGTIPRWDFSGRMVRSLRPR